MFNVIQAIFVESYENIIVPIQCARCLHRPADPKLRSVENRATVLWIKQMTAIIVIIRIMISEREVGSLGLTSSH